MTESRVLDARLRGHEVSGAGMTEDRNVQLCTSLGASGALDRGTSGVLNVRTSLGTTSLGASPCLSVHPNILFIFTDQQRADTMACYPVNMRLIPVDSLMLATGGPGPD